MRVFLSGNNHSANPPPYSPASGGYALCSFMTINR
jgi:hypothetical protein